MIGLIKQIGQGVRQVQDTWGNIFRRPWGSAIGTSGTEQQGNYFDEEYLQDLKDMPTRCDLTDRMRKEEPDINLSLLCWELPVLSAIASVKVSEEAITEKKISEQDAKELEQFVSFNLFENMKTSWSKRLREMLSCIQYGFSVMEIVWEVKENKQVYIKDLEYRKQKTILWQFNEAGKFTGVKQTDLSHDAPSERDPIPKEKLLTFAINELGDNLEGIGVCRYQYRAWKMKSAMMKLLMIGFQRFLVKTPFLQAENQSVWDNTISAVKELLRHWTSGSQTGGVIPAGWKDLTSSETFSGSTVALKFVEELSKEIHKAALTQHVTLGEHGVGSLALSKDMTDFFRMALQGIINTICDVINFQLIPRLVDYNYSVEVYPELQLTIEEEDLQQWAEIVHKLITGGVIPAYPELQKEIVKKFGYPDADLEEYYRQSLELQKALNPAGAGAGLTEEVSSCQHRHLSEPVATVNNRTLTDLEQKAGGEKHFADMQIRGKKLMDDFIKATKPILLSQQQNFLKKVKGKSVKETLSVEVPKEEEYRKQVESYLVESSLMGLKDVSKETKKPIPPGAEDKIKAWAKDQSYILSRRQSDYVRQYVVSHLNGLQAIGQDIDFDKINKTYSENIMRVYSSFLTHSLDGRWV